jgi:thioredoxin-related protein
MSRFITLLAAILAWVLVMPAPALALDRLPQARNFKADGQDAAARKIPIMVLFSSPDCHFCHRVKNEYLLAMLKDPAYKNKVLIREVDVGSQNPLTLFDGRKGTDGAFAAESKVFMVPTIKVFDAQGREMSDAIVGLLSPDYYFGYLDAAIEEGIGKIRGKK